MAAGATTAKNHPVVPPEVAMMSNRPEVVPEGQPTAFKRRRNERLPHPVLARRATLVRQAKGRLVSWGCIKWGQCYVRPANSK